MRIIHKATETVAEEDMEPVVELNRLPQELVIVTKDYRIIFTAKETQQLGRML